MTRSGAQSLVSVVVPVFNGERFLSDAIGSILAQAHRPLQVLVVDDGSTDGTADLARAFGPPVEYSSQANGGAAAARNTGVRRAAGRWLAFLDADDLWTPDKLQRQLAALAADPRLDFVLDHAREEPMSGGAVGVEQGLAVPGYLPGALLVARETFLRVGLFDAGLRVAEFIDWHARATELGLRSAMLPEVLLIRRLHDDNLGIRERHRRADYARAVKAALDRRRRQ
jgi:glycosyltransferase involved in cell wall biosynthesis